MTSRTTLILAAVFGFLAVAIGAFAAHGLKPRLTPEMLAVFEVGVRYHAYHALALLGLAAPGNLVERLGSPAKVAVIAFTLGIVLFAGSLYALALSDTRWLGAVTPLGGVCFLVGWTCLFVGALKLKR